MRSMSREAMRGLADRVESALTELSAAVAHPEKVVELKSFSDAAFGLGHMDKDPTTGRTGWAPSDGGAMEFNDSAFQSESAGAKIRRRHRATNRTDATVTPETG
ncbi:hypothetical protein [Corynebacterium sp.]|uniref:hypothetical protein n=1 Tax=Corynebacterium sp. TaxID=1720 RepID=UPI001984DCFE|nr:hypothetical protein [Corynebacterium sp.]HHU66268.1 hypothetical protein [Corynebacterium sp.]